MIMLVSCVYVCFQGNFENLINLVCVVVKVIGGLQVFYDWNGINQVNVNGNYQVVVFDGKLCSGNNLIFRGLDVNCSDWQIMLIQFDVNGRFIFVFKVIVLYVICDWCFFVICEGWQLGSLLCWVDLQEFCMLGNILLLVDGIYKL